MNRCQWSIVPLLCAVLLPVVPAGAEEQTAAVVQGGGTTGEANPSPPNEAMTLLQDMAGFLAQAPQFRVNLRIGYDVMQASGQKVEFGEHRSITLHRPDRLRIEVEQSDGDKRLTLFDGQAVTVFDEAHQVYAQTARPGNLDDAVTYFVSELRLRLPLAMLLVTSLPDEIQRRVQAIDYVERSTLTDVPTHHLAGRMEDVDFQIWVAEGDPPLPQRVVITYKGAPGEPQFSAQFSDWNLAPDTSESLFAFTPPQGTQRIAFLNQLQRVETPPDTAAEPDAPLPAGETK